MLPIVVGVVIAGGAGVALYNAVGSDEPRYNPPQAVTAPAPPVHADTQVAAAAPEPETTFSEVPISADDFVLGKKDAPVTIVEYASMTCPHCAQFHATVLPAIKKDYIDKGLVRLVFRDFPLDRYALTAAVISRCAGRDRYFSFVDTIFSTLPKWRSESNPMTGLSRIARLGGMSQAEFNACLKNEDVAKKVLDGRLNADKSFGIRATPTLIVNGDKFSGGLGVDQLRAVIDAKLK
jgi:protein-disulfide isomerase